MVFTDESYYESKVFLKAYKDSQDCLREAAEYAANLKQYDYEQTRISEAKKQSGVNFYPDTLKKGPSFNDLKEVKLFQFSNQIFKKYFSGFDSYDDSDYNGFKNLLSNGFEKMKSEAK